MPVLPACPAAREHVESSGLGVSSWQTCPTVPLQGACTVPGSRISFYALREISIGGGSTSGQYIGEVELAGASPAMTLNDLIQSFAVTVINGVPISRRSAVDANAQLRLSRVG